MVELDAGVVLVLEGFSVDGLSALPAAGGVAPLDHEVLDDPVEGGADVVPLHAQLHEVANRLQRPGSEMQISVNALQVPHHVLCLVIARVGFLSLLPCRVI